MALAPHHKAHLRNSGLSDEVIKARGYSTVDRRGNADDSQRRLLKRLGFTRALYDSDRQYPGILIPVFGPTGALVSHVYRPDIPRVRDGKPVKYETPRGGTSHVDVHPLHRDTIADPTVPLVVVEGHKKSDAITTAARAESIPLAVATINGVFGWRNSHGVLGEWESIPLKGRTVHVVFDADATTNPSVAYAMERLGRWLISRKAKPSYVVVPKLGEDSKAGADDYLVAGNTLASLLAIGTGKAPVAVTAAHLLTEAAMAERIAQDILIPEGYRWCEPLGGWFRWDGICWIPCGEEVVLEMVRRYILDLTTDAVNQSRPMDELKRLIGFQSYGKMRAVLNLAHGIPGVGTEADEFDAHPDLLNCANGPVDLSTGELLDPNPELLLTKSTGIRYVPDAKHDDWNAALEAIPDEDTRDYLHRYCGQAATGHPPGEDMLLLAVGSGANGKTTILNGVHHALGGYATIVSDRALISGNRNHSTELMDLRGARFAWLEETPEQGRLDVVTLKRVVGTKHITARLMHRNNVTFDVSHTLVISTNYLPVVDEADHGTWRRLMCVEFPLRYVRTPKQAFERQGDLRLRDRLTGPEQSEAILSWLVAGAKDWYAAGRQLPDPSAAMVAAVGEWRRNVDLIEAYVAERLVPDPGWHITGKEMAADFNNYLLLLNLPKWGQRKITTRFRAHDSLVGQGIHYMDDVKPDSPQHGRRSTLWADDGDSRTTAWVGVRFADGLTKKPGFL